jgi:pyrroline-5-carboxylate reductase
MSAEKRVGIIGGGKMGEALIAGLLKTNTLQKDSILVGEMVPERREHLSKTYGIECLSDNAQVARRSDILILCVRPRDMAAALASVRDSLTPEKLLISIAAGVTTRFIQRTLNKSVDLVRAMPNNPCTIGEGMIVLTPAEGTSANRLVEVERIFASVGRTLTLEEGLFDAVTGLSASGPAYVYLFIEALADGGVKVGIPKDVALTLAAQTVLGSAMMVLETREHPAKLKDLVATPAGTTVAGLYELEEGGLRAACIRAVEKATARARELSSQ